MLECKHMNDADEETMGDAEAPCCPCCCFPTTARSRSRSTGSLREPLRATVEDDAPAEPGPLQSPRAASRAKVVEEVLATERTYVADL